MASRTPIKPAKPVPQPEVPQHVHKYVPLRIDSTESGEHIFAVTSDIHFASRYHFSAAYQDFVQHAYKEGVRLILNPGDSLNGMYRHSRWEETAHGFEAQAEVMVAETPALKGLQYYCITGNHDETFFEGAGFEVGRAIENTFRAHGRSDLHYVGERSGYLRLKSDAAKRGAYVHLWHPRGSASYSDSYKLQKKVESYMPGQKPDFLFCGHFHKSCYLPDVRGVHAFMAGTFQAGGGPFGNSLESYPRVGGWIVRYTLTTGGTVRNVRATWRGYSTREIVREVELG